MIRALRAQTTIYCRGTCSYRAPELIADEKASYTNKVDIWAIGCILYELAFGKKAFADDFAVRQYSLQWSASAKKMALPSTSDTIPHESNMVFVSNIIRDTITIDQTQRPKAEDLHQRFINWGSSESLSLQRDSSSNPPPTIEYEEDVPGTKGKIIH